MIRWIRTLFGVRDTSPAEYDIGEVLGTRPSFGVGLKYYLYISTTKVEMLFPQIPRNFLRGASADIKLNLGVVSATLKAAHQATDDTVLEKLASVSYYIRSRESLGTVDQPEAYLSGTMPMRYGVVSEYASQIAFFAGTASSRQVGLIGAVSSLVGVVKSAEAGHSPYYYTLRFLNNIADAGTLSISDSPPYDTYQADCNLQFAFDLALTCITQMTL